MIIPAKSDELSAIVRQIVADPARYGIVAAQAAGVTPSEVLEALMAFRDWRWLSVDDIAWLGESWGPQEFDGGMFKVPPGAPALGAGTSKITAPLRLYVPADARGGSAVPPGSDLVRAYLVAEVALLVSAHRQESFEHASVAILELNEPGLVDRWVVAALAEGVVLLRPDRPMRLLSISEPDRLSMVERVVYDCRFQETLYRSDLFHQREAAKHLFSLGPKEDVEADLVQFLADPNRDVRANVAGALGVPAYGVQYVPGRPIAPREVRLEEPSVEPQTLRALLGQVREESDAAVIDWVICTLTAQSYAGKLAELVPLVKTTVTEILLRTKSDTTRQDCRLLLSMVAEQ
jgi:hypothetical protein